MNPTTLKSDKILPCPFCGSTTITVEWEPCDKMVSTDTTRRWFAECVGCACQGPFCQKEPEVIPAWNKRDKSQNERLAMALEKLVKPTVDFYYCTYCDSMISGNEDHHEDTCIFKEAKAVLKEVGPPNA